MEKRLFTDSGFAAAITALVAILVYQPMGMQSSQAAVFTEVTEADIYHAHADIFETLFDAPWDEDNWVYPLVEPVDGTGIYSGENRNT